MRKHPAEWNVFNYFAKGAAALTLALCLGAGARAQEEQKDQKQQDPQQQSQQDQQQAQQQDQGQSQDKPPAKQDAQAKPTYPSQDADKPPYSRDRMPQSRPAQDRSMQNQSAQDRPSQDRPMPDRVMQDRPGQDQPPQNAPDAQYQQVPPTLTIPAGTVLTVRTNDFLSSDKNQVGDHFTAELERPIVVNGWVVARRGQILEGQVKDAKKAGRVKGTSELGLELTDLTVVDGKQLPILTQLWKGSGGTSHGADAATIGGATGLGAAIGAAADWGTGAAIGAGAGAVAGIATVLLTRGRPTILAPETELTFRLEDPVKVDTTQSQQAYYPVTQEDIEGRYDHRRPRLAAGYPPYPYYGPYYGCGYYGPCYAYPGFVGFYGGYWGRGYRGGFHGFGGRGWGGFRR